MRLRILFSTLMLTFWVSNFAYGGEQAAEFVRQTVEKNVLELIEKFDQERQYYETDPERFLKSMDEALGKIVDFRRIAARVMGKHARKATKEQRDRFVEVFKTSLYEAYTSTMIESGVYDIKVVSAKINTRSNKRAKVDLEVTSDNGNVFSVIYSMHRTRDNQWLMENIIVFGVNVGLAFRDRFETQMRRHKGDVGAVIESWSAKIDIDVQKES